MEHQTSIVAGSAGTGKTTWLIKAYADRLTSAPVGSLVWISPTQRAATEIRRKLAEVHPAGILAPGVMTFDQFAERVLENTREAMHPLSPLLKRQLLSRIIQAQVAEGRLRHFAPIARMGGLLDLVAEFISDMKRLEIWPEDFQRACSEVDWTDKNREIYGIYARYQEILHDHKLFDAEGRFWSARALLRDNIPRRFEKLDTVVVDGFADFTRTQHEILQLLGERCARLYVSLPLERTAVESSRPDLTPRADLFAKPRTTLVALRKLHPRLQVKWTEQTTIAPQSLGHLERHLFGDPRRRFAAPTDGAVRIIAAGAQQSELERIAREIKKLLLGTPDRPSARPEEIAVVFRAIPDPRLILDVFTRFGLPVACEQGRPLSECPSLKALLMLLRMDQEDWPFAQVLGVLTNTWLQPPWNEARTLQVLASADVMVRHCQIVRGRELLQQRLTQLAADADDVVPDEWQIQRHAKLALRWFNWISQRLATLPEKATPAQWRDKLAGFVRGGGWAALSDETDPAGKPWRVVFDGLLAIGHLDERLFGVPRQLTRAELIQTLEELGSSQQLPREQSETGCVRVLSASSIRTLNVPYLFLADMSERAFPAPAREDRLLAIAEQQRLVAAGLPLPAAEDHHRDEMLMFYEVVTRATEQLTLSYASLDEKAQPLVASPFLQEVQATCGAGNIVTTMAADLSPLPPEAVPYSLSEWRLQAMTEALDAQPHKLAQLLRHAPTTLLGHSILSAVEATSLRRKRGQFGPYDGLLGERAATVLADLFQDHIWSASELELYGTCPFKFMLQRLLKLEPLPGLVLEVDYGRRGSVTHEVLARFHRKLNDEAGGPTTPDMEKRELHIELLGALLEEQLQVTDDERTVDAAMRLLDREEIRAQLEQYFEAHLRYETHKKWGGLSPKPAHFEVSFGLTRHAGADISRPEPLELEVAGETLRLSGRIDRIDLIEYEEQLLFSLIDYKNTAPKVTLDNCLDKNHLQLPLYAIAVEQLLLAEKQARPLHIGYWQTRTQDENKHGFTSDVSLGIVEDGQLHEASSWTRLRISLLERIASYQRAVRKGCFPVYNVDEECTSRCPYKTVCRIGTIRALEKRWEHETE